MDKSYDMSSFLSIELTVGMLGLIVIISILSGYNPAWILSGLNPVVAIKGKLNSATNGLTLRKALIVFQFFISASMVLGTFLVLSQVNYMREQDLGFDKEQTLVLDATNVPVGLKRQTLLNLLEQIPAIEVVSHTNALPARPGWQGQWAYPEQESDEPVDTEYLAIDENYVRALGLEVIAGNNFDLHKKSQLKEGLLINESCVIAMGWNSAEDAIGKRIVSPSNSPAGIVIGVVKDYHGLGLQNEIWPKAMDYGSSNISEEQF